MTNAIEDAQTSVRFLRAHATEYGIDPMRIAMSGISAGGVTALQVGNRTPVPGSGGTPDQPSDIGAAVSLSGAVYMDGIDAGDAPSLLFHGTEDPLIAYSQAVLTRDRSKAAGVSSYLITWNGEGHTPYTEHRVQILTTMTNFLYNTLHLTQLG